MKLVGDHIATLKPYEPGKPISELERELGITDSVKLASNENPLGPSTAAIEAVQQALYDSHYYPDAGTFALRAKLAEWAGVEPNELLVGNGSNELLTLVTRTFCGPGDNAVISEYAFIAYRIVLTAANVPFTVVPMADGYVHDLDAMAAACDENTKVLFVANPNNPTGTYVGVEKLREFLEKVPEQVIVVLDEAYVEYALAGDYASAATMRETRERLVVCRTFSKCYGLAGMRCGFAIAPAELVDYIHRIREPFNVNSLAQIAAHAAIDDVEFIGISIQVNEDGRRRMEAGLETLGLEWLPSQTNFLLVKTPRSGIDVYNDMLKDGVIVRPVGGYGLHDWIRITIGTGGQVSRCLESLGRAVGAA